MLCKVADAEDKTTGGVLLPESAQKKPTSGKDDEIWCCLRLMACLESSGLRFLVSLGSDWKSEAFDKLAWVLLMAQTKHLALQDSPHLAGTAATLTCTVARLLRSLQSKAYSHLQGTAHRGPALHSGVACCKEAGQCCMSHKPLCLWLQGTLCQWGMVVWGT